MNNGVDVSYNPNLFLIKYCLLINLFDIGKLEIRQTENAIDWLLAGKCEKRDQHPFRFLQEEA